MFVEAAVRKKGTINAVNDSPIPKSIVSSVYRVVSLEVVPELLGSELSLALLVVALSLSHGLSHVAVCLEE